MKDTGSIIFGLVIMVSLFLGFFHENEETSAEFLGITASALSGFAGYIAKDIEHKIKAKKAKKEDKDMEEEYDDTNR